MPCYDRTFDRKQNTVHVVSDRLHLWRYASVIINQLSSVSAIALSLVYDVFSVMMLY